MRGWRKALVTSAEVAASVAGAIPMAQPACPAEPGTRAVRQKGDFLSQPACAWESTQVLHSSLARMGTACGSASIQDGTSSVGGEGNTPCRVAGSLACTEMWLLLWRSPPGSSPGVCPLMCDPDNCLVSRVQQSAHHVGRDFNWLAFPCLFLPPTSRECLQLKGGTPGTR